MAFKKLSYPQSPSPLMWICVLADGLSWLPLSLLAGKMRGRGRPRTRCLPDLVSSQRLRLLNEKQNKRTAGAV